MGKVIENTQLINVFDATKSEEVEAVIDTGATMLVVPQDVVDRLGLTKTRDVHVKYANGKVETKGVYSAVTVKLKGRSGTFDVLAENVGSQALIGQVVLEVLDLVVDPRSRQLTPNPSSPDTPMVEVLGYESPGVISG